MSANVFRINSIIKYDSQHTDIGINVIKHDLMDLQNVVYLSTLPKNVINIICDTIERLIDLGFTSNQLLTLYNSVNAFYAQYNERKLKND